MGFVVTSTVFTSKVYFGGFVHSFESFCIKILQEVWSVGDSEKNVDLGLQKP